MQPAMLSLIVFVSLLVAPLVQAQQRDASSPTAARAATPATDMSKPTTKTTVLTSVYHDADGKVIDKAAFFKAIRAGQHFTVEPRRAADQTLFTLLPPGVTDRGRSLADSMAGFAVKGDGFALQPGDPMPEFKLPLVPRSNVPEIRTVSPASLRGAVTLVDFFFAKCAPCIAEVPALNAYAAKHPDMKFLAVTFDDLATAKAFIHQRGFGWPVAHDGMPLINQLQVRSFPTLLLLDANGNLLAVHSGSMPIAHMRSVDGGISAAEVKRNTQVGVAWLDNWVQTNVPAGTD